MKVGDTYPVTLAGHEVARARVTSMEEGIATLRFDGVEVKMSYVTQLAPEAPAPVEEPTTQTIVTGVDRRDNDGNIVLSTGEPSRESAPVGDSVAAQSTPAPTDVSTTTETPAQEVPEAARETVEKPSTPEAGE